MFIQASCALHPNFYLLTLGHTCRYLIGNRHAFSLVDLGVSGHMPLLEKRLHSFGFHLKNLKRIFVTHTHVERIGGLAAILHSYPGVEVVSSAQSLSALAERPLQQSLYAADAELSKSLNVPVNYSQIELAASFDIFTNSHNCRAVTDGEKIEIEDGYTIRALSTPGHAEGALSYVLEDYRYLIADEVIGFYRGKEFVTPAPDISIEQVQRSLRKISAVELQGLCFTNFGVISGSLVVRHITALLQNLDDIRAEYIKAKQAGLPEGKIIETIHAAFFETDSTDPVVRYSLKISFEELCRQLSGVPT